MTRKAEKAPRTTPRDTTIGAAWGILIFLGGTQVAFNVGSALRHSTLSPVPVLAGVMPVVAAVLLSHLAASRGAAEWFRWLVALIMVMSMAVSIGATVEATAPVFGAVWRAVILGIVLDSASLLALRFIMDRHGEKAAEATAVQAAQDAASSAMKQAAEARALAAKATSGRDAIQAELDQYRADTTAELAAARAELQGLKSGLNKRRSSGRKPTSSSGSRKPASSGPNSTAGSGSESDVDTQAAALAILDLEPDISGGELGRRLGVSESYGCRLKRELARVGAGPDADMEQEN